MKGRFAPSPTGHMHVGNLWVAFLSYWSARRQNGEYIVRIEDVDTQRSKPIYADHILEDLSWLGFTWDEVPTYQSQRLDIYERYLQELRSQKRLYPCYCNRARLQEISSAPHQGETHHVYDGYCLTHEPPIGERPPSWRFHMENTRGSFQDIYRGTVDYEIQSCNDDIVLKRWDGMIAYHLAVVIDDYEMGVTEVVRGNDLLPVTGHQIVLAQALGFPTLQYGHASMLVDVEGYRLSKRQQSITIRDLQNQGATPERLWAWFTLEMGLLTIGDLPVCKKITLSELLAIDIPKNRLEQDIIKLTNFDIMV